MTKVKLQSLPYAYSGGSINQMIINQMIIYAVANTQTVAPTVDGSIYPSYGGIQRSYNFPTTASGTGSLLGMNYVADDYLSGMNYVYQMPSMPRLQSILSNIGSLMMETTPEEEAAREKRRAKQQAADARAESLLFTILTPDQVRSYKDESYFDCPVGERLYRLRKGRSMNVELIEAGKAKIKFCALPNDHSIPVPDVMLSQLLMLRANEQEFLSIANRMVLQ